MILPGKTPDFGIDIVYNLSSIRSLHQVKVLDGEKEQKGKEVAELQTRLSLEEQREEERGREIFSLKQKLAEADTARTSIKKEVRREGELWV